VLENGQGISRGQGAVFMADDGFLPLKTLLRKSILPITPQGPCLDKKKSTILIEGTLLFLLKELYL